MRIFNPKEMIEQSAKPEVVEKDLEIIKSFFSQFGSIKDIRITGIEKDDHGVDYTVVYEDGIEFKIDVKRRSKGCKKFWRYGPELQIELWSNLQAKKIGWALDDTKETDFVIFAFDKEDYQKEFFVIEFQKLKRTVKQNGRRWMQEYKTATQRNKIGNYIYDAMCLFVPAGEFLIALEQAA